MKSASVAELVDAPDSKSGSLAGVRVRVSLEAPSPQSPSITALIACNRLIFGVIYAVQFASP